MNIRRIEINNFRGIKQSVWDIPEDRKFVCLIGPGDGGKTTILDALHYSLGENWKPSISDTDFHGCDTAQEICIRVVITNIPMELLKDSAFGLALSGIDDDGILHQDPIDGTKPCIIVQLKIDESLEPLWTVERVEGGASVELRSNHRKHLSTFKVDERTDSHLRWTRTSALGRLSRGNNSADKVMTLAARAASKAINEHENEDMDALTQQLQAKINKAGGGSFSSIKPGLDTSFSSVIGNLALYESDIPLTNFGLGTKRISALAVQQIATPTKPLLLIDEIETGLEPHRLVRLIRYLRDDESYSQVFITTHSPIAVEQSLTENLAVVRTSTAGTQVSFLPDDESTLRLRRSRPSSFLGSRILVVEGKTEEGLILSYIDKWDEERIEAGLPVVAGEGSVIQDGQGGAEASIRASALKKLGYDTGLLVDNDDSSIDAQVEEAVSDGVELFRWNDGFNLEHQIITVTPTTLLNDFVLLAVATRVDEATILNDLSSCGLGEEHTTIKPSDWVESGMSEKDSRAIIAEAASKKNWFKNVDGGKILGVWVRENESLFIGSYFTERIKRIKGFLYPTEGIADAEPEE